jgi:hypothetical protein
LRWLARGLRPRRTALYDFRDRLGPVIDALVDDTVALGRDEGFVEGRQGVLDGTTIRARASRHRLLNPPRLQERIEALERATADDDAGRAATERPAWMAATAPGRRQQLQRHREARTVLERRSAENARKPKDRRLDPEKVLISVSDPEAPLGRDKEKVFGPLYTAQFLIEPSSLLIVAYDVFARATDAGALPPMLDRAEAALGRALETVIADAGYVSILDLRACGERGVELIAPIQENDYSKSKSKSKSESESESGSDTEVSPGPPIGKDQFTWEAEERTYRCPRGHRLDRIRRQRKGRRQGESVVVEQYRCPPEHCRDCPLKARCVKDPQKGRIVSRVEGEELLEEHRRKMATERAKGLKKLRGQVVERGFGDAKQHRDLRKLHGHGLLRAKAEVGLVVLAQNALMLHRLRQNAANPVNIAA